MLTNRCIHPGVGIVSIFSIMVALAVTDLPAAQQTAESVLESIRSSYGSASAVAVDFELSVYWKVRDKEDVKSGKLLSTTGDRFRLELGKSVYVCDGHTFWQYSGESNQVTIKQLLDVDLSMHPSKILRKFLDEVKYTPAKTDGRSLVFSGSPVNGADESTYTIYISKAESSLEKIVVSNPNGNTSTYTFKKIKLDPPIPGDAFTFTPPENANVADLRE